MLNFINKHKGMSVVVGLSLVLFIIMLFIFISLFFGTGDGKYGDRLDRIEKVELKKSFFTDLEDSIKENESVIKAKVRLQGKIVYIDYEVDPSTSYEEITRVADDTLEKFTEKELEFYDISYLASWKSKDDKGKEKIGAIAGTKHPLKEKISWSLY